MANANKVVGVAVLAILSGIALHGAHSFLGKRTPEAPQQKLSVSSPPNGHDLRPPQGVWGPEAHASDAESWDGVDKRPCGARWGFVRYGDSTKELYTWLAGPVCGDDEACCAVSTAYLAGPDLESKCYKPGDGQACCKYWTVSAAGDFLHTCVYDMKTHECFPNQGMLPSGPGGCVAKGARSGEEAPAPALLENEEGEESGSLPNGSGAQSSSLMQGGPNSSIGGAAPAPAPALAESTVDDNAMPAGGERQF